MTASRLAAGDEDETAGGLNSMGGAEAAARARGRLVSAMMKRHLVESVVPVMVGVLFRVLLVVSLVGIFGSSPFCVLGSSWVLGCARELRVGMFDAAISCVYI